MSQYSQPTQPTQPSRPPAPVPAPYAAMPPQLPPQPAQLPPDQMAQQLDLIRRQQMADARMQELAKSAAPAYLLWFFLGIFGAHRFYLNSPGVAFGQLFTLGGLGFWTLIDVFFINRRLQMLNSDLRRSVYAQYGVPIA